MATLPPDQHPAPESWLRALMDVEHGGPAPKLDDLATRRWVDEVLARAEPAGADPIVEPSRPRPARRWVLACVGLAAAALVVVGWVFWGATEVASEPGSDVVAQHQEAPDVSIPRPTAEPTRVRVPQGEPLAVELGPGVSLLLGGGARAGLFGDPSEGLAVSVEHGWVRAEVEPGSQAIPFRVRTRHGTVEVLGTIFEVEATPDAMDVRVRRGRVRVTDAAGKQQEVVAGQALVVGAVTRALNPSEAPAEPKAVGNNDDSEADREAGAGLDAAGLMARAAHHRRARRWSAAAEDYARVRRRFADDPAACPARLSEADTRLDHLGQAKRALALFDGYLRHCGGALAQEAHFGRASALRRLGRAKAEREALAEFIRIYPASVRRPEARVRLADLRREAGACDEAVREYRRVLAARPGERLSEAARAGLRACDDQTGAAP